MSNVLIRDKDGRPLGYLPTDYRERMGVHNLLHVQDQKALGLTCGQHTTGAWRTRTLNTVLTNNIEAILASNRITLPAGEYYAEGRCLAFKIGSHSCRIYNITTSSVVLVGFMCFSHSDSNVENLDTVDGRFTLATESVLEFQQAGSATDTYGCGTAGIADIGQTYNVFADLKIWKLA